MFTVGNFAVCIFRTVKTSVCCQNKNLHRNTRDSNKLFSTYRNVSFASAAKVFDWMSLMLFTAMDLSESTTL